ncbi:FxsA family protein [Salipiger aestuarii]|uniref:FxsA family protein n=1 Tax=Salipiger aestuarii TaxID=568098 RepID=UPI00025B7D15|nr:FxsA family protein [Salipiger aestuarii]EIE52616.1 FxsA [Citreicella sp. 357]KAA8616162.1 exlusion protein FxsA [Salipiger aestuarii]
MWLFLAFLMVPLIEIGLFIQIGGLIGLWPTLAIVVITAVIGTSLVRSQGLRALGELQGSFSRLEDPTTPLAHGAMILLAGALLLTPGFFTDACGFALLVPGVRLAVMRQVASRVSVTRFEMGARQSRPHPTPGPRRPGQGDVIDGDYTEVPPKKQPNHPGSGWTKH